VLGARKKTKGEVPDGLGVCSVTKCHRKCDKGAGSHRYGIRTVSFIIFISIYEAIHYSHINRPYK